MGVAHTMPSTPARAFSRNIKGMSSPPLRNSDKMAGCTFLPTDWNTVMASMVTEMHGPVMQMIRWNSCP